ncbi:glycosyltransferase family 4 protein [Acetomicrobium sp.]|uniref:glycosyltransferase family 4 protein n=1 Tax=Acetomicrobium sp. TaxID=1872099 RepID=UPI001BCF72E4|nr:glycosyltransferase family 4 protein [Acetomicrobium sp.]
MKKILQAIDAGGWGGAEKVVVMISNELAGMGHDVEVWVRRGSILVEHLSSEVKVRVVPFINDYEPITPIIFAKAFKTFDIVHVHLGRAALLSGYAAKFLPEELRRKLFCHMHLYHKPKHYRGQGQIICVSKAVEDYVKKAMPWAKRTWVVYNGIDMSGAPLAEPLIPKKRGTFRIGLLASFKAEKGHADLIKAFAGLGRHLPVELLLGGEGPLLSEAKKLASDLGVEDKVNFLGAVPPEKAFSFWKSLDVACVPSYAEGFCLSMVEAMACGLPVAGYAEAALSEVAGEAAVLVPVGDVEALAAALERVIADESLRKQLSSLSLKRSGLFSAESMAENLLKVYESALYV